MHGFGEYMWGTVPKDKTVVPDSFLHLDPDPCVTSYGGYIR